jgi:hypothetical protein
MKANDSQLQQMFVRATDEVIRPAPWLESQVIDALSRRGRVRRRAIGFAAPWGFVGPGLRLTAGLVALLIAVSTVAVLLMSSRLFHNPPVPGRSTVPSPQTFTPSPAVRDPSWPAGGPVPTQLAGSWQPDSRGGVLHLGEYTWELGDDSASEQNLCGPGHCYTGNVVVNGSEIDFIDTACTIKADYGFERFSYVLTGNTLVLTRAQGPGQSNCVWLLAGIYSRVS